MVEWYVYLVLTGAVGVAFWTDLVEATFLSVRPISLMTMTAEGDARAAKALNITEHRTRLVSSTTLVATFSDVIIASATTFILYGAFGTIGWIVGSIVVSLLIMVFLNLVPKAIGIENSVRMAIAIAPSTNFVLKILSPAALPLTALARRISEAALGKPAYKEEDLEDEFESVLVMLEKAGQIRPDAGKLLRSTLASSKVTALDIMTPISNIVSVGVGGNVTDALKLMGNSKHPHLPVYDSKTDDYVGEVTFRSLFRAFADGAFMDNVTKHMVRPVKVGLGDTVATIMDHMQKAGVTMAFVLDEEQVIGVVTLTDILETILGMKV